MLKNVWDLPIYGGEFAAVVVESADDADAVCDFLREFVNPEERYIDEAYNRISQEAENGGECFYHYGKKHFAVVLYPATDEAEAMNVFAHEIWHMVDHIADMCAVTCEEAKAYLCGYLSKTIYQFLRVNETKQ